MRDWRLTVFTKGGQAIAFQGPEITPDKFRKLLADAEGLGGQAVVKGKTESGGEVEFHCMPEDIECWVIAEISSSSIAKVPPGARIVQ